MMMMMMMMSLLMIQPELGTLQSVDVAGRDPGQLSACLLLMTRPANISCSASDLKLCMCTCMRAQLCEDLQPHKLIFYAIMFICVVFQNHVRKFKCSRT